MIKCKKCHNEFIYLKDKKNNICGYCKQEMKRQDPFGKLILGDTQSKWFNKGIEHQRIKEKVMEKDLIKKLKSTKGKPEGIITERMIKSIFKRFK